MNRTRKKVKSQRVDRWLVEMAIPLLGLIIVLSFIGFWSYNTNAETTTFTQVILPSSECEDEGDNDLDGLIDFPADTGCTDADDDDEDDGATPPPAPNTNGSGNSTSCDIRGDINRDCKVDLQDFSILTYWMGKTGFPVRADLDNNGKIDLTDFSILIYYWKP